METIITSTMDTDLLSPNVSFMSEEDSKLLPAYFKDTPETTIEQKCPVSGAWPKWVKGSLVRTGYGVWSVPLSETDSNSKVYFQHVLDGLAQLHKFRILDGEVHYSSRHTAEGIVRAAKKEGHVKPTIRFGFDPNTPLLNAEDPCSALLGKQQSLWLSDEFKEPDAASVNITPRRGFFIPNDGNPFSKGTIATEPEAEEIVVFNNFNIMQVCDMKTLEPKRLITWAAIDSELKGTGICSHPPKDSIRGEMYNFLVSSDGITHIFALDIKHKPAKLLWKSALPCDRTYCHSMALTEKYVIFIRVPFHFDYSDLSKPLMESFVMEEGRPTEFYLLNRSSGEYTTMFLGPPLMFYHTVNAYDYLDAKTNLTTIHVDLSAYSAERNVFFREWHLSNILDPRQSIAQAYLVRYELAQVENSTPSLPGRVTVRKSFPGHGMELPRINKVVSRHQGYRFVYAVTNAGGVSPGTDQPMGRLSKSVSGLQTAFYANLGKFDWLTGDVTYWSPSNGETSPSEPIFLPRPGAIDEDDGIILTIVCKSSGLCSVLIALDGRSFQEIARADMPQVYGFGPHGTFIENVV